MKAIKYLLAAMAVSSALVTTAFAASLSNNSNYTFSISAAPETVKPGETIKVSVFLKDDTNNEAINLADDDNSLALSIGLNFKNDVLVWADTTKVDTDTGMTSQKIYKKVKNNVTNLGLVYSDIDGSDIGDISSNTALVTYSFTVNEGVANAIYDENTPLFELVSDRTSLANNDTYQSTLLKTMGKINTIEIKGNEPIPDDGNRVVATTDNIDVSGLTHPYFKVDLKRGDNEVESNNFWLPTTNGVYGGKTYVRPILKYTIGTEDTDPQKGDKFEMKLYDWVDGAPVEKNASATIDVK